MGLGMGTGEDMLLRSHALAQHVQGTVPGTFFSFSGTFS